MPFVSEFFWLFGVEKIASPFTAFLGVDDFSASLGLFLLPLGRPRPRFEGVSASLPGSSSSSSFAISEDSASDSPIKSLIRLGKRCLPFGLASRFLVGVDSSMFPALSATAVRHCLCFSFYRQGVPRGSRFRERALFRVEELISLSKSSSSVVFRFILDIAQYSRRLNHPSVGIGFIQSKS